MAKIEIVEAWKYKDKIYEDYEEAKAAREKDLQNCPYQLYDIQGRRVDELSDAYFVYLPDEKAGKQFVKDCEEDSVDNTGITENDSGLFFWNEWDSTFEYFDRDLHEGMYKVLAQILKK